MTLPPLFCTPQSQMGGCTCRKGRVVDQVLPDNLHAHPHPTDVSLASDYLRSSVSRPYRDTCVEAFTSRLRKPTSHPTGVRVRCRPSVDGSRPRDDRLRCTHEPPCIRSWPSVRAGPDRTHRRPPRTSVARASSESLDTWTRKSHRRQNVRAN